MKSNAAAFFLSKDLYKFHCIETHETFYEIVDYVPPHSLLESLQAEYGGKNRISLRKQINIMCEDSEPYRHSPKRGWFL